MNQARNQTLKALDALTKNWKKKKNLMELHTKKIRLERKRI